jgi:recombination protein RecR
MVESLEQLVAALSRLPAIGQKSAWRLALYLVDRPQQEAEHLAACITAVKEKVRRCSICFNFSESDICSVCASPRRNKATICVVERASDVFAIEKSGQYRGVYHVLGGVLSPIDGVTAEKLTIASLKQRVEKENPDELIIGLGASSEAETTTLYIARILANYPVKITRLARGLPAGTELEYVDQITLSQALNERTGVMYNG